MQPNTKSNFFFFIGILTLCIFAYLFNLAKDVDGLGGIIPFYISFWFLILSVFFIIMGFIKSREGIDLKNTPPEIYKANKTKRMTRSFITGLILAIVGYIPLFRDAHGTITTIILGILQFVGVILIFVSIYQGISILFSKVFNRN